MSETPTKAKPGCGFRSAVYGTLVLMIALATIAALLLMQNITARKREAQVFYFEIVKLNETVDDPALWGQNFPRQYDSYRRTVDTQRTRHGGSEAFQKLDEFPVWREIFAGYAFAVDYREERGHAYMLSDQRETERVTDFNQPGACLHCHASNIPYYREVGIELGAPGSASDPFNSDEARAQLMLGFEEACAKPYAEVTTHVQHPVSCLDCHDPGSMQLRVTRPGFINGIRELAKSDSPVPHLPSIERWRQGDRSKPYEPNVMATRQEMRSMSCGQCHVEYYFKGDDKLLTYPWHSGLRMDDAEKYYDDQGVKDWTHARTGADVLKAQHPEFELWSQGIHARSGVSCADCHMPYKREGALKVSDHHARSPLLNIARSCQTCHRYDEEEILARATAIQDRTRQLEGRAEQALLALIEAIDAARKAGANDEILQEARAMQRKSQWRLDYISAENSRGFHAPQESARILGESIDYARQGEISLLKTGATASE